MPPPPNLRKWWPKVDYAEVNWSSAFLHILSTIFAIGALGSNEWLIVTPIDIQNATKTELSQFSGETFPCNSIGCRDFWRPISLTAFYDEENVYHVVFNGNGRTLIDCVVPLVANLFYILIALCFVISFTSSLCAVINILPFVNPFLQWLKKNNILEMCNMVLTLCCTAIAFIAQSQVSKMRPFDEVSLGMGVLLICCSEFMSFCAAAMQIRHSTKINRMRRIDNQQLLCARSLRSWRDAARRNNQSDQLPIIDFESYLDSATSMSDLSPRPQHNI